jgi:uracil-DNA glycosylase family 4
VPCLSEPERTTTTSRNNTAAPRREPEGPSPDCPLCPRLAELRRSLRASEPTWFNGPVPSFGPLSARLLVVGLAPGLQGANRTGRPFTGDYAGVLLYQTLLRYGFARGRYEAHPDDGLVLVDTRIVNAVRCVPPGNKPTPAEISMCRQFLTADIAAMDRLRAVVVLGRIAHGSVVATLGGRASAFRFAHGAEHTIGQVRLFDSYHCSRLNTNTGVLTPDMFHKVFADVRAYLGDARSQAATSSAFRSGGNTG